MERRFIEEQVEENSKKKAQKDMDSVELVEGSLTDVLFH